MPSSDNHQRHLSERRAIFRGIPLTMTGCRMHELLRGFMVESLDNYKITTQTIGRFFSFKSLTSLTLSFECSDSCSSSDLKDDDIDLLTKAMPRLEI
jgi:hypothetical protein